MDTQVIIALGAVVYFAALGVCYLLLKGGTQEYPRLETPEETAKRIELVVIADRMREGRY